MKHIAIWMADAWMYDYVLLSLRSVLN